MPEVCGLLINVECGCVFMKCHHHVCIEVWFYDCSSVKGVLYSAYTV